MISTILAALIRLGLVALAAFFIIVLMEHGPDEFVAGIGEEAATLADFARGLGQAAPVPDPAGEHSPAGEAPEPSSAPEPSTSAPSPQPSPLQSSIKAWEWQQRRTVGTGSVMDEPVGISQD
ncbi:MAG: hypothetical protein N2322_00305 [Terrimicrobiaceae bacterium]|nr:hypothetical protein [Terrimicrobiaceae bacterium]